MFLGKTKDTWKKELGDLFFFCLWITGIAAIMATLVYGTSFATGRGLRDSFDKIAKIYAISGIVLCLLSVLFTIRRRYGSLLELGRLPGTKWASYLAAGCAVFAILLSPMLSTSYTLLAVIFLSQAVSRLLIVEDGIWVYYNLLKWQDIESYEWQNDSTLVLKSHPKRRFLILPVASQHVLPIPAGQREAVSQLLEQYLCKQTTPG